MNQDLISYKSTFNPKTTISIIFEENPNYQTLVPLFNEYGFGFYSPEFKTILIDGQIFLGDSGLTMDDLKFIEAHEISHLLLNHSGPRSEEDEIDADLGAYILLTKKGLSTDRLVDKFEERHGIPFDEKLLERVKDIL